MLFRDVLKCHRVAIVEDVLEMMSERTRDKLHSIRYYAVLCLSLFQEKHKYLAEELLKVLETETNKYAFI